MEPIVFIGLYFVIGLAGVLTGLIIAPIVRKQDPAQTGSFDHFFKKLERDPLA